MYHVVLATHDVLIALWQGRHLKVIQADDTSLCDGFRPVELNCDFRWISGAA